MFVVTVSLVPCNNAKVDQDFISFSVADISCGGTFANFNEHSNQSWMAESKSF